MTKDELQLIRERADKATRGPWYVKYDNGKKSYGYDVAVGMQLLCDALDINTAKFIAQARTDIPALLAYIAKLDKVVEAARDLRPIYESLKNTPASFLSSNERQIYAKIQNLLAELDKGAE